MTNPATNEYFLKFKYWLLKKKKKSSQYVCFLAPIGGKNSRFLSGFWKESGNMDYKNAQAFRF
jgi:hypothetical protein